ncbi:MAG TPA: ABC transporter permease [Smithella sp.]|jgi:ABC-2 type transport system permease protein|nr:ABC transporter permease [Smithella sp.]OQC53561.1 MAG: Inner membrane transport permease YbhR [Deltaproteobacteria bacterium ADurb.Bin022]HOG10427.1 ABC transporter permease [Smithella sp.]HOO35088.1 ABC transporter permease [Smithella sp.]HOS14654.1 ABC transporter permease [Smithella sp.]
MNWLRIRELVRKEFIQLFSDKRNRALMVVFPFIMMLVFGYVVNYDIRNVRMAVLDYSKTHESRSLIKSFEGGNIFHVTHNVIHDRQMTELLLRQKIDMGIKISHDFASVIRAGQTAPVQLLVDGSMSNMTSIRVAYTATILEKFNREELRRLYPMDMRYGRVDARIRTWYNPNLDSQFFFVPGIVAFLIMLTSFIFTSIAIIREKEDGTMEQLIVTPIRSYEFIIGKTIPYILIALLQLFAVTGVAVYWFEIPFKGSFLLLLLAACLFLLSTLGIGLFISTISSTKQQAMMTAFFFVVPFFMLSGFVFPIANMPDPVQWMTYLNPLRFFLVIIRNIFLKGVGFDVLWPQYLALTILGAIVFTGAIARSKKRLD